MSADARSRRDSLRLRVIRRLAAMIAGIDRPHPVRVGIDGVDCSGKTILAGELARELGRLGREVVRGSIDGFHNPAVIRHRQGCLSSRGYYEDSFDLQALLSCLLVPLGPGGDGRYRRVCFDFRTDSQASAPWEHSAPDAILVFEGVFLLRPELVRHWDFSIFVHAPFEETLRRACVRDLQLFGSVERVREAYRRRYIPGQQLYLESERPARRASVVLVNTDPERPRLTIGDPRAARGRGARGQRKRERQAGPLSDGPPEPPG